MSGAAWTALSLSRTRAWFSSLPASELRWSSVAGHVRAACPVRRACAFRLHANADRASFQPLTHTDRSITMEKKVELHTNAPASIVGLSDLPGRIGLGSMGMSEFYGHCDDITCLRALHDAWELRYSHFDTADMYGQGHNERLLGRFFADLGGRAEQALLATKVGIRRVPGTEPKIEIDSSPDYLRAACERSLERLGVERLGLLYLH